MVAGYSKLSMVNISDKPGLQSVLKLLFSISLILEHLIIEANKKISKSKKLVLESFSQTLCLASATFNSIFCKWHIFHLFFMSYSVCSVQCEWLRLHKDNSNLQQRHLLFIHSFNKLLFIDYTEATEKQFVCIGFTYTDT